MSIFRRRQPAGQIPVCLRCHILDAPTSPGEWWFLPGCDHVGHGHTAVCGPCKQQIDAGSRVPGTWNCRCGAAPVLALIAEGETRPSCCPAG